MRAYGPHDPDTAPKMVVVSEAGRYFHNVGRRDVTHPLPAELVRQRQQLNNKAWHNGK